MSTSNSADNEADGDTGDRRSLSAEAQEKVRRNNDVVKLKQEIKKAKAFLVQSYVKRLKQWHAKAAVGRAQLEACSAEADSEWYQKKAHNLQRVERRAARGDDRIAALRRLDAEKMTELANEFYDVAADSIGHSRDFRRHYEATASNEADAADIAVRGELALSKNVSKFVSDSICKRLKAKAKRQRRALSQSLRNAPVTTASLGEATNRSGNRKVFSSMFVTSLSGGRVIDADYDEPAAAAETDAGGVAVAAGKRNRKGQRHRQKIWEQKFGEQARHKHEKPATKKRARKEEVLHPSWQAKKRETAAALVASSVAQPAKVKRIKFT